MKFPRIKKPESLKRGSLQSRFLFRVLVPPFLTLLIISIAGFVLLSAAVRDGEISNLQRVAAATAAKFDREFALRQTILKNTGVELFEIKKEQLEIRKELEKDYKACRKHVETSNNFTEAPGDSCKPFYAQFAVALQNDTNLQAAINTAYTERTDELLIEEQDDINKRVREFVKYFPETSQILITDTERGIISRAENGVTPDPAYAEYVENVASRALDEPVEALAANDGNSRQMIFAYPIKEGAVLASYNLDNANFLYPSWKSAPIDNSKAYVVVADSNSKTSYPKLQDETLYVSALEASQDSGNGDFSSAKINYLATSEPVGNTGWFVIASSPAAIALETLANTQLLVVFVAGLLLVIFIWAGSLFIRRTIGSIMGLVGGAVIFSAGGLDHRIDSAKMSDKEFAQLAETMNKMAGKIQEAEKAIDQKNKEFISVATHEIKAPITAIIGNLSMMLDDGMGAIDETARKLSTQAYKGTVRLRELVNELLDIARLESGSSRFDLEPIDLVAEIKEMIEVQRTPANEKGITIEYQPPDDPITVTADKTKLEIVLTNFISNGIKYNRPQGRLIITQELSGDHVQINVQDTGLGIPDDQKAKMFQKFFRVEGDDRAKIPGTGLGMFITKKFIEGMGGKLWFESEHGKGTVFHFTFPLSSEQPKTSVKNVPGVPGAHIKT